MDSTCFLQIVVASRQGPSMLWRHTGAPDRGPLFTWHTAGTCGLAFSPPPSPQFPIPRSLSGMEQLAFSPYFSSPSGCPSVSPPFTGERGSLEGMGTSCPHSTPLEALVHLPVSMAAIPGSSSWPLAVKAHADLEESVQLLPAPSCHME